MANCIYGKRWIHTKRSAIAGRWNLCAGIGATLYLACIATYASFHQTNSPETNHTNTLDGAHLFGQCGKFKFN